MLQLSRLQWGHFPLHDSKQGAGNTCETTLVAEPVLGNVLSVLLGQLLNGGMDGLDASLLPHGLGGVVSVGTSTVPVTFHGLGLKSTGDAEVFTQTVQQPTCKHDVVTDLEGSSRANLELPLAGHDLSVDTTDLQTCLDASVHVCLNEGSPVHSLKTHSTVEGALGVRETSLGPSVDLAGLVEHGVLLLESKEGLLRQHIRAQDVLNLAASVGFMGGAVGVQDLAEYQYVVLATDGVRAGEHGVQDAVGELALSLSSADTKNINHSIKLPL